MTGEMRPKNLSAFVFTDVVTVDPEWTVIPVDPTGLTLEQAAALFVATFGPNPLESVLDIIGDPFEGEGEWAP